MQTNNAALQLAINAIAQEMDKRYERALADGSFKGTATEFVTFDLIEGDMGEMITEAFLELGMSTEERLANRVDELIDNGVEHPAEWWDEARTIAQENGDLFEMSALSLAQYKLETGN